MFESIRNNQTTYYQSSLLRYTGKVTHAFSTRLGGVSPFPYDSLNLGFHTADQADNVRANRRHFAQALGLDPARVATVRFVHGDKILDITSTPSSQAYLDPDAKLLEADGLSTNLPGQPLFITFSDCAPLLLYDPVQKAIAAVHAGWRGVAKGLPIKAVHHMAKVYGSYPKHLLVVLGPTIGPHDYEVGPDVEEAFQRLGPRRPKVFRPGQGDRSYLDMVKAISWQIKEAGVKQEHFDVCPLTTFERPDLFFSYRRSGPASFGVMGALISLD